MRSNRKETHTSNKNPGNENIESINEQNSTILFNILITNLTNILSSKFLTVHELIFLLLLFFDVTISVVRMLAVIIIFK